MMRALSIMSLVRALPAFNALIMAIPMEPSHRGYTLDDIVGPYLRPPQNDPVGQWHQNDNVAPPYHISPILAHTRVQSSSYDSFGQYSPIPNYDRFLENAPSSALHQPDWQEHWLPPPTPNAAADQAILDRVMNDFDRNEAPSPPLHHDDRQAFVHAPLVDEPEQVISSNPDIGVSTSATGPSRKRKASDAPSGTSDPKYAAWNQRIKDKMLFYRAQKRWPEPASFSELDYLPSWEGVRSVMVKFQEDDNLAREWINSQFFAGNLHWVDFQDAPNLKSQVRRNSPFVQERIHRQLPIHVAPPPGRKATKVNIHITDHGVRRHPNEIKDKNSVLEGKPFYLFWGIPQEIDPKAVRRRTSDIYYYGAGYIDHADNGAIDLHLLTRFNRWAGVARGFR